ncbi:MAG: BBP7 family outer membrane beta-barrel protein [Betaproteobacteria bacterium]
MRKVIAAVLGVLLLAGGAASAQTGNPGSGTAGPFTLDVEALVWWFKNSPTPTPIIADGIYGQPNTNVLLGGGEMNTNPNPGFRLTAGYALDRRWGLEGNFLYIGSRSDSRSVSSPGTTGSTDLLLPYFDVTTNRENVTEISLAPVYAGSARVELSNSLTGVEANATYALDSARPWDVGLIGGFRWMQLKEEYTISTSSPFIPPNPGGDVWMTTDKFSANNNFYGAQVGVRARYDSNGWFAGGLVKVGLGAMVQTMDVSGSLATNDFNHFGPIQTYPGGYFALPTNIGGHTRTVFAVVPEVRLNAGYAFSPSASVYVGYSFLYANNVARPGNQINRNINPTLSAAWTEDPILDPQGPAQPSFSFNSSNFWAQGINLGVSIRF